MDFCRNDVSGFSNRITTKHRQYERHWEFKYLRDIEKDFARVQKIKTFIRVSCEVSFRTAKRIHWVNAADGYVEFVVVRFNFVYATRNTNEIFFVFFFLEYRVIYRESIDCRLTGAIDCSIVYRGKTLSEYYKYNRMHEQCFEKALSSDIIQSTIKRVRVTLENCYCNYYKTRKIRPPRRMKQYINEKRKIKKVFGRIARWLFAKCYRNRMIIRIL